MCGDRSERRRRHAVHHRQHERALEYAKQTCAWLAACNGPLGGKSDGQMHRGARSSRSTRRRTRNRQPKGVSRTYWQCFVRRIEQASVRRRRGVRPSRLSCSAPAWSWAVSRQRAPAVGARGLSSQQPAATSRKTATRMDRCASHRTENVNSLCTGVQGQTCTTRRMLRHEREGVQRCRRRHRVGTARGVGGGTWRRSFRLRRPARPSSTGTCTGEPHGDVRLTQVPRTAAKPEFPRP